MGKVIEVVRHPRRLARLFHGRKDAGMALAEYAIGIVVVIAFGALVFGV
ncbi:MAG: DUF4244 domain-containing protein, partial [Propionibacteriaceae bacterium]|nr:DUF4244 domain-containing protein [Propionibacteriaceae bacterium]